MSSTDKSVQWSVILLKGAAVLFGLVALAIGAIFVILYAVGDVSTLEFLGFIVICVVAGYVASDVTHEAYYYFNGIVRNNRDLAFQILILEHLGGFVLGFLGVLGLPIGLLVTVQLAITMGSVPALFVGVVGAGVVLYLAIKMHEYYILEVMSVGCGGGVCTVLICMVVAGLWGDASILIVGGVFLLGALTVVGVSLSLASVVATIGRTDPKRASRDEPTYL